MKIREIIFGIVLAISSIANCGFTHTADNIIRSDDKYYWFIASGIYISYGTVPEEEKRMNEDINSPNKIVHEDGYKKVNGMPPNVEPVGEADIELYSKK